MEQIKKRPSLRLGSRRDVDMTEGNIFGHIIRFAIPLLIGNLFQQLYNMVDTWVVGRFVSDWPREYQIHGVVSISVSHNFAINISWLVC